MPQEVERCVNKLLKDSGFKPQAGRTKKESAWAVCQAQYNKSHKGKESLLPFIPLVEGSDGKAPTKIQVLPIGLWEAPYLPENVKNEQGKLEITATDLDEIIANFNSDVRKGVPIDIDHDGGEAAGWMTALERVGEFLEATVEWTKLGLEKIKAKQYKFFSPEFSPSYTDPETGEKMGWVLIGGGLVNRPLFKELAPITAKDNLTASRGDMILLAKIQSNSTMNKKLEAILAKDIATLTEDEQAYIRISVEEFDDDDEQKKVYRDIFAKEGDACKMGGKTGKITMKDGKMTCVVKGSEDGENEEEETETDEKAGDNSETETETETEEDENVKGKEKTVAIKASELIELKANAKQGVEALSKLHSIEASEKAQRYIVGSEGGRVLPAGKDDLTTLILSFSDKQAELFKAVMKNIPDAQMFREIGDDESNVGNSTQQFEKAIQKIMADDKVQYKVALKKAKAANPALYKAYQKEVNSN